MFNFKKSFFLAIFSFFSFFSYASNWDWESIDVDKTHFPENFLWGTSTAEYQNSGAEICSNNNWARWEEALDKNGNPRIKKGQHSNNSCDHFNRYREDIKLMKELGVNAYRFSVEWSMIEPQEGVFDEKVIKHYQDLLDELNSQNITPMVTLHHFTIPKWFEDKGGFEKEENIEYFVRFSEEVFYSLSSRAQIWCTINEPAVYSFCGYVYGTFPPGVTNIDLAGRVLQNLMKAHVAVYNALKNMPNGKEAKIGLVHNLLKFEAFNKHNPVEAISAHYVSNITTNAVMNFLEKGEYKFYVPFTANVSFEDKEILSSLDFIGLNYYSHPLLKMNFSLSEPLVSSCHEEEIMADVPYRLYPQGIYEAVKECSKLNVPIYITENGIADKNDDRRKEYIKRYLFALSQAIEDGYDVRGYFYWTLMDNFEWDEGTLIKFGLYSVDPLTKERKLKDGAHSYIDIIDRWKEEHQPKYAYSDNLNSSKEKEVKKVKPKFILGIPPKIKF